MNRHVGWSRDRMRRRGAGRTVAGLIERLDPVAFVGASWWLALVAIAVLQQAHGDLHEHLELAPLLHLVRDAALAVPGAAIAIAAGLGLAGIAGGGANRQRFAWVGLTALAFGLVSIPGNQLHGFLFGAEAEEGLSPVADAVLDGGIAMVAAALALLPVAIVIGPPIRPASPASPPMTEPFRGRRPGPTDASPRSAH
jgi:hypothetical protein